MHKLSNMPDNEQLFSTTIDLPDSKLMHANELWFTPRRIYMLIGHAEINVRKLGVNKAVRQLRQENQKRRSIILGNKTNKRGFLGCWVGPEQFRSGFDFL